MVGVNDIRDINQTIFLHMIREQQPISRADIAKHTGLQPFEPLFDVLHL